MTLILHTHSFYSVQGSMNTVYWSQGALFGNRLYNSCIKAFVAIEGAVKELSQC